MESGVLWLRQINTCRKVSLQVHFLRWRHFALPSMSLNFYVITQNSVSVIIVLLFTVISRGNTWYASISVQYVSKSDEWRQRTSTSAAGRHRCQVKPRRRLLADFGTYKYGVRSLKIIWAPLYSCTHWLRPRNSPPPFPPHLGSYTRAILVSKDRRDLFVTPWLGLSQHWPIRSLTGSKSSSQVAINVYYKCLSRDTIMCTMDEISIKTPNPKCRLFLKIYQ